MNDLGHVVLVLFPVHIQSWPNPICAIGTVESQLYRAWESVIVPIFRVPVGLSDTMRVDGKALRDIYRFLLSQEHPEGEVLI